MRRSVAETPGEKERPRTSRRRSDHPAPAEDYFDSRGEHPSNGQAGAAHTDGVPLVKTGGDKTASWVHSVSSDPPPPPPIEGTIIDAPAHFGSRGEDEDLEGMDELTAREMRQARRRKDRELRDRDGYSTQDQSESRRRRRDRDGYGEGASSGGGSTGDHRSRGVGGVVNSLGYDSMGNKIPDGRPGMAGRDGSKSWLKKIAGL